MSAPSVQGDPGLAKKKHAGWQLEKEAETDTTRSMLEASRYVSSPPFKCSFTVSMDTYMHDGALVLLDEPA